MGKGPRRSGTNTDLLIDQSNHAQAMPEPSIPFSAKYGLYTVLGYVREPTEAQKTYQQYPRGHTQTYLDPATKPDSQI